MKNLHEQHISFWWYCAKIFSLAVRFKCKCILFLFSNFSYIFVRNILLTPESAQQHARTAAHLHQLQMTDPDDRCSRSRSRSITPPVTFICSLAARYTEGGSRGRRSCFINLFDYLSFNFYIFLPEIKLINFTNKNIGLWK